MHVMYACIVLLVLCYLLLVGLQIGYNKHKLANWLQFVRAEVAVSRHSIEFVCTDALMWFTMYIYSVLKP